MSDVALRPTGAPRLARVRGAIAPAASPAVTITARADVSAARETVFSFLADLENHWRVADPWVHVRTLEGPLGGRWGGIVVLRGPLGLRRTARTRVRAASFPVALVGIATLGRATCARVAWTLTATPEGTGVELAATVETAGLLDRLLLRAGGARWLKRRFAASLGLLAARLAATDSSGGADAVS